MCIRLRHQQFLRCNLTRRNAMIDNMVFKWCRGSGTLEIVAESARSQQSLRTSR